MDQKHIFYIYDHAKKQIMKDEYGEEYVFDRKSDIEQVYRAMGSGGSGLAYEQKGNNVKRIFSDMWN